MRKQAVISSFLQLFVQTGGFWPMTCSVCPAQVTSTACQSPTVKTSQSSLWTWEAVGWEGRHDPLQAAGWSPTTLSVSMSNNEQPLKPSDIKTQRPTNILQCVTCIFLPVEASLTFIYLTRWKSLQSSETTVQLHRSTKTVEIWNWLTSYLLVLLHHQCSLC